MIDRLIELAVRRRGWVLAAAGLWAIAGLWAALQTPIDALPDLSENQVIVFTEWPGHGPEEVEGHVTRPLSLLLQGLPGVRAARGSSDVGYSMLHLIFEDSVSLEEARERVNERLAGTPPGLPPGVAPRLAADGIPIGQIFWYTVEGEGHDLGELRAIQDGAVAPQLRSVPGVAEVASVGGFVREIHIRADPAKLLAYGASIAAVEKSVAGSRRAVGGHVLHTGNAEYLVTVDRPSQDGIEAAIKSLEDLLIPTTGGKPIRLKEVSRVSPGAAARRGVLEKDGNEVVGGVVHLRYGENPLEVTRRVKQKIRELRDGLPEGVRIVPCYDRTPLIEGAVGTVTRTLLEAMLVATVCVVLVLRHARASLVVTLTLPLSVLSAFGFLWLLRAVGGVDVQTNIMSLAGLVISIGVLVDSSIVMSENVMFRLRAQHRAAPIDGSTSAVVIEACRAVGRPVFFSILIMLVSFVPVFALGGIDGKMYSPLAWTKSLALVAAAALAVTVVPALCAVLIRGRIPDESESWLVRSVVEVYRPVLSTLLDRPGPLVWILAATAILAAVPLGVRGLVPTTLGVGLIVAGLTARTLRGRVASVASLVLIALVAQGTMRPLGTEIRLPLDEGMLMDMPITVPRASIAQSADDLKARNMVLCRFPEVAMVVGKAGRAETAFDPAPLDMIETMIEFRPKSRWPKRRLLREDAERTARDAWEGITAARLVINPPGGDTTLLNEAIEGGLLRYDAIQREVSYQSIRQFQETLATDLAHLLVARLGERLESAGRLVRPLSQGDVAAVQQRLSRREVRCLCEGPLEDAAERLAGESLGILRETGLLRVSTDAAGNAAPVAASPGDLENILRALRRREDQLWKEFLIERNADHYSRAATLWPRIVVEELIVRTELLDESLADVLRQAFSARYRAPDRATAESHHHGSFGGPPDLPLIDPHPQLDRLLKSLREDFTDTVLLWKHDTASLGGFGGEMDRALQMPGWTNVWTKPIQNRVDMLATGVNAEVGVRVLGRDLDDVVRASEEIAATLQSLPGTADVIADPIRGKGYLRLTPDAALAAMHGVRLDELNDVVEAALAGRVVAREKLGGEQLAVRLKLDAPEDEESLRRLLVPAIAADGSLDAVTLDQVASVSVAEGPATIKSEDGWLRNYVRLNVRDSDPAEFVENAKRTVAAQVKLPAGVFLEWTGQYEHSLAARRKLLALMPVVAGLILLILYATYRDWADALTMLVAVPGALAGGVLCQWLLGYPFSIAVGVGYIACFGMAAATGIVMLVYLREAVERAGGLAALTPLGLRAAVLDGAVHRLRPKLLTEATTVLSIAPMLWSTGVGAEVIRPMAAPVLGGILVADEVIDLLIPVIFYHVRRRRLARISENATGSARRGAAEPDATLELAR